MVDSQALSLVNWSLSQGFPQLWKILWKFRLFDVHPSMPALFYRVSFEAKVHEGLFFLGFLHITHVTSPLLRLYTRRKCQFS